MKSKKKQMRKPRKDEWKNPERNIQLIQGKEASMKGGSAEQKQEGSNISNNNDELKQQDPTAKKKSKKGGSTEKKKGGNDAPTEPKQQDPTSKQKPNKGGSTKKKNKKNRKGGNSKSTELKQQNSSSKKQKSKKGKKKGCKKQKKENTQKGEIAKHQCKQKKKKQKIVETTLHPNLYVQKKFIILLYDDSRRLCRSPKHYMRKYSLPRSKHLLRTSKYHERGLIAKKRKTAGAEKAGRKQRYICRQHRKYGRTVLTRHARQRFRERGPSTSPVYDIEDKTTKVITYVPMRGRQHKENCRTILKEVWRNKRRSSNLNIPRTRLSCQDAASLAHSKKMCKELDHWRRLNRRYTSYRRAGSVYYYPDFQQPILPQSLKAGSKWKRR